VVTTQQKRKTQILKHQASLSARAANQAIAVGFTAGLAGLAPLVRYATGRLVSLNRDRISHLLRAVDNAGSGKAEQHIQKHIPMAKLSLHQ
jgi:hypothetical protein